MWCRTGCRLLQNGQGEQSAWGRRERNWAALRSPGDRHLAAVGVAPLLRYLEHQVCALLGHLVVKSGGPWEEARELLSAAGSCATDRSGGGVAAAVAQAPQRSRDLNRLGSRCATHDQSTNCGVSLGCRPPGARVLAGTSAPLTHGCSAASSSAAAAARSAARRSSMAGIPRCLWAVLGAQQQRHARR